VDQPTLVPVAAFASCLQSLAGSGALPNGWTRLSESSLRAAGQVMSRSPASSGMVDIRLALVALIATVVPTMPTPTALGKMVASLAAACAGRGTCGTSLSMPASAFARAHLWFQDDGDAEATASLRAAVLKAWTGDDGRVSCTDLLLDVCCTPGGDSGAGTGAMAALCHHETPGTLAPRACPGLYKAFLVMALLEKRVAGVPGAEGGVVPVWEDLCISPDAFRAVVTHEAARGLPLDDVDAVVASHTGPEGVVSFHEVVSSTPAWLMGAGQAVPYSLPPMMQPLTMG